MSWYLGQSWLIILLSILLGLLIGWALWRRPWHKRYFSESEAVTTLTRDHSRTLADRDAEIGRLRGLLDERATTGTAAGGGQHVAAGLVDTHPDRSDLDGSELDGDANLDRVDVDPASVGDVDEVSVPDAVPTAESIDLEPVDVPSVDVDNSETANIDMADIEAAQVDVSDDASATAQVLGDDSELRADAAVAPAAFVDLGESDGTDGTSTDGTSADGTSDGQVDADGTMSAAAGGLTADDDLERIEGIGPRIASALRTAGITTFRALAESDVAALQSALESGGLRFAPSLPTWSRQARLLADGDEAGFVELTEQLVAGRDVGRRG